MRFIRTAKTAAERIDSSYVRKPRRGVRAVVVSALTASALAMCWWWYHQVRGDAVVYSPGHVASVHAMWETDCSKCHEPDGGGGFSHSVNDAACRKCHDAGGHGELPTARPGAVGSVADAHLLSHNCADCHIEHRGHDALMARSNLTCLECHRDLSIVMAGRTGRVQSRITGFALGQHPWFGREMTATKVWTEDRQPLLVQDPPKLKFSHLKHMGGVAGVMPLPGQTENCTYCHRPETGKRGDRDTGQYMNPVRYESGCAASKCHPLELIRDSGLLVPHERLELSQQAFLGHSLQLKTELTEFVESLPADKQDERLSYILTVRRGALVTTRPAKRKPEEWAAERARELERDLKEWYADSKARNIQGFEGTKTATQSETKDADDLPVLHVPGALAYYFALGPPGKLNTCAKCHVMPDDADVGSLEKPGDVAAATLPATQPAMLPMEPLPTGLADGPRRWFVHSMFDHKAHQSTKCQECHASAARSENLSDVALPMIETCVRCHRAPDARRPGAGIACQECHIYHDRSLEHQPTGMTIEDLLTHDRAR